MLANLIILIRFKDWLKNIIIVILLIFSGNTIKIDLYNNLFISIIIFCLSSSIIYVLNDIKDQQEDRLHKSKIKYKPLANGKLKNIHAFSLLLILFSYSG